MIAVVGRPVLGTPGPDGVAALDGTAASVAVAAARGGATVELVGSVGDDPAGDRVAVELGRARVGHAALLRDPAGATLIVGGPPGPAPRLDGADVQLGLRYVTDCRVIVLAEPTTDEVAAAVVEAAAYHGAAVIALLSGDAVPAVLDAVATVLRVPEPDPDKPEPDAPDSDEPDKGGGSVSFASFVGALAVALDAGRTQADAIRDAAARTGWERSADG